MTFVIRQEAIEDDYAINRINRKAFGPGRYAKTAYRMREGIEPIFDLGFVAENHLGYIVGTIRYWPLLDYPDCVFLGPIAVDSDLRNMGLGINLMYISLEKAMNKGFKRAILVGDEGYYKKFSFSKHYATDIKLYGSVHPERLLGKIL